MKEFTDKSQGSPASFSPAEEDDPSAQPNIALMFELREREIERKKRRRRSAVLLFAVGALATAAVVLLVRNWKPTEDPAMAGQPAPAEPAVTARQIREQGVGDYVLRTIAISGLGGRELTASLYDFDANRFMRGQAVLDDPNELRRLVTDRAAELKDSLIVVFAGASFDGEPGGNRKLCRRRGCYVGKLASSIPGVAANRLWVIPAGEHKSPAFAGPDEERREEDVLNSPGGEQTLRAQRKLLLITIPFGDAADGTRGNAPEVVKSVVDALRRANLLPTDYDHGQTEPATLADLNCDQLTP